VTLLEFSLIINVPFVEDLVGECRLGMRHRHLGQDGDELPGAGQGRQRGG
jgi:hypothetical protein